MTNEDLDGPVGTWACVRLAVLICIGAGLGLVGDWSSVSMVFVVHTYVMSVCLLARHDLPAGPWRHAFDALGLITVCSGCRWLLELAG